MIKKLVLSLFLFTLTFGIQPIFAKKKFHRHQKKTLSEVCKVVKQIDQKNKSSWWSRIFGDDSEKSKKTQKKKKKSKKGKISSIAKQIEPAKKTRIKEKQIDQKKKRSWWSRIFGDDSEKSKKTQKKKKKSKKGKISSIAKQIEPAKKTRIKEKRSRRKIERRKAYKLKKDEIKTKKALRRIERETKEKEANYQRELRRSKLVEDARMRRDIRLKALEKWRKIRLVELERDYADGLYADLYTRPAWPFRMLFSHEKNRIQVVAGFEHATNYYDSTGSSHDLSADPFGTKDIYFRDILLALDLNNRKVGNETVLTANEPNDLPWYNLVKHFYNKKIIFHSKENKLDLNFNCGRYIKDRDVFIGFELPVAYKQRRLKFDTDVETAVSDNVYDAYLRTFQKEIFDYVLKPKNLIYQPKSSVLGIGDVSTFINFNIQTKYVEQFKVGGQIIWPTAKEADTHKLWPVELGKGFTQFTVFSSIMFHKQAESFNPHMFAEFTYAWAGHKDKRVQKVVTYDGSNPGTDRTVGSSVMAHGDRVEYTNIGGGLGQAFSEPDTKIRRFADNVKSVKIRRGAQFELRFGNIWEKFIARRGFLDVYYDFRAKIKDRVLNSGLDEDVWLVHGIEGDTMQLEHKAGFDFAYQYDKHSRLNYGCEYSFAGINVADTFRATFSLNIEF